MPERGWLYFNERMGSWLGNHLIADNPGIRLHLIKQVDTAKVTMIPYGADRIDTADSAVPVKYGLIPGRYALLIARPEPENSILEIVSAYSSKPRGMKLVILGRYDPDNVAYHKQVMDAASPEVVFIGAIYDKQAVSALRFHSPLYLHGHQVGGTNPSLVEAMGAGSGVLAHGNHFNRWVAGPEARYFDSKEECSAHLDAVLGNTVEIERMREGSRKRHAEMFTWENILGEYERLLNMVGFESTA